MTPRSDRDLLSAAEGYEALWRMVTTLKYRDGWTIRLFGEPPFTGDERLNLNFECSGTDNRDRETPYVSAHLFIVPKRPWTRRAWRHWLFGQCRKVDLHEAMELFEVEGYRPFWPDHVDSDSYVLADKTPQLVEP